jgi:hypothetical protein
MAVRPTATSIGKNIANIGIKSVPSPKPEKRVNPEVMSAVAPIIKYSIKQAYFSIGLLLVEIIIVVL